MASQLAELDSRELGQIERALGRLKQGTYGLCESCQKKIPRRPAQRPALHHAVHRVPARDGKVPRLATTRRSAGNWEKVYDAAAPIEDQREVDLSEIDLEGRTRLTAEDLSETAWPPHGLRESRSGIGRPAGRRRYAGRGAKPARVASAAGFVRLIGRGPPRVEFAGPGTPLDCRRPWVIHRAWRRPARTRFAKDPWP